MLYIGIDPGPEFCGLVVYHVQEDCSGVVVASRSNATVQEVRTVIDELAADGPTVAIEHTHPGPPSWSVIRTTVVVGRLLEYAWQALAAVITLHDERTT